MDYTLKSVGGCFLEWFPYISEFFSSGLYETNSANLGKCRYLGTVCFSTIICIWNSRFFFITIQSIVVKISIKMWTLGQTFQNAFKYLLSLQTFASLSKDHTLAFPKHFFFLWAVFSKWKFTYPSPNFMW